MPPESKILAAIKEGCLYCSHHISRKFNVPTPDMSALLHSMVARGLLAGCKPHGRRNYYFCQVGSEPNFEKREAVEGMALPRTFAVLTGEIAGYGAEMERHRALAMMVRR